MKLSAVGWTFVLVAAAFLGVGLLGGGLTGQATGAMVPVTSGTVLSVIGALLAIVVLIIAGLQHH